METSCWATSSKYMRRASDSGEGTALLFTPAFQLAGRGLDGSIELESIWPMCSISASPTSRGATVGSIGWGFSVFGRGVRFRFSSKGSPVDAASSIMHSFGSNPTGDASGEEDLTESPTGAEELAQLMVSSGVSQTLVGVDG